MSKEIFDKIPKEDIKELVTSFFYYWYNQPGTNTEEGFEKWYELITKNHE